MSNELDDALKLEAGAELNTFIAQKVLGLVPCDAWELFHHRGGIGGPAYILGDKGCIHSTLKQECYPERCCMDYSGNIGAAWALVDRHVKDGGTFHMAMEIKDGKETWKGGFAFSSKRSSVFGEGPTSCMAICRAEINFARENSDRPLPLRDPENSTEKQPDLENY